MQERTKEIFGREVAMKEEIELIIDTMRYIHKETEFDIIFKEI